MVKVLVRTPFDRVERVWATPVTGGLYRLENSLFLGYELSYQDIVETVPSADGSFPVVSRARIKSGNRTIRAHVQEGLASEKGRAVRGTVSELGSTYEMASEKILSINIPPTASLEALCQSLADHGADFEYVDPRGPGVLG